MITIRSQRAKRSLLVASVLTSAILMFLLGRACSPHGFDPDGVDGHAVTHAHGEDPEVEQIYYCSMHPDQRSTDPKATCPICGMAMIPMPSDDGDDPDMPILRVSERAAALMNVEVAPVTRRGSGDATLRFQGHVELAETRLTDVVARSDGFVERQHAASRWQPVRRGQPLAEIDSPSVTAAARELLVIRQTGERRAGYVTVESGKKKLRRLGAPERYIQRVLETGEAPRTYVLRSPVDGVLTEIDGREGHALKEGQRLVQLADLSRVWVQLQAYESDLPGVRVGQSVDVTTQAHPGEVFEGTVAFIDPAVDAARRTIRLRIEVDNRDGRLKPGMFVRGIVRSTSANTLADREDALLMIPSSAPLLTGRRAVVYVQIPGEERPTFEGRDVELGSRVGDGYEVHSGLEEGDLVVTRGAFRIDSELQIRGRPSMMNPGTFYTAGRTPGPGAALAKLSPDDIPEQFAASAKELVEHYFELTAGLADDDLERSHAAVAAMRKHLSAVDAAALPAEATAGWQELEGELRKALSAMAAAKDLEGLRASLGRMSEPMERVAKTIVEVTELEAYRGTCPMTPDGEGHWLQPEEEIANPYMGHRMLACGTIERVGR